MKICVCLALICRNALHPVVLLEGTRELAAEVCDICSDILLAPDTIRHMEAMLKLERAPSSRAPVLAYAQNTYLCRVGFALLTSASNL